MRNRERERERDKGGKGGKGGVTKRKDSHKTLCLFTLFGTLCSIHLSMVGIHKPYIQLNSTLSTCACMSL